MAGRGIRNWKSRFLGKWRIVWMDEFCRKGIDMEIPENITLEKGGRMQMGGGFSESRSFRQTCASA